jgi:hypothetical protein
MVTVKLDSKKRATIAAGKPGQVMAVTDNGDGSVTLTPVKPETKEPFPPGCKAMKGIVDRLNKEWAGVKITVPVPSREDFPD